MKAIFFFFVGFFLISTCSLAQRHYSLQSPDLEYSGTEIIVKMKPSSNNSRTNSQGIKEILLQEGAISSRNIVPANAASRIKKSSSISSIYKVQISAVDDPVAMVNRFLKHDEVEYAEPYFLHRPLFIPNDPGVATSQNTYLQLIEAYDAWSLEKSDSTIVIAIIDTGVKLNHEDLEPNLFINYNDPPNGIDDDSDGFIDNYFGWDFADDDNYPFADLNEHGTMVAGVAAAKTNNGIGIAGIGFNSQFMAIKIFKSADDQFAFGYEAIVYAADMGASVINLSWGSPGSFSQFGQDMINYAVLEKDAVVVAAAGNTDADLDFYPASFDNVISVGASDLADNKASFGTYSSLIDLMAPGVSIYSAINNGGYGTDQGSSFSTPLTSGAAALVRSRFPELSALQVAERLRVTADDIYGVGTNNLYAGKLGKGRLNILTALTDNISPSVRLTEFEYFNRIGSFAFAEDTVSITGTWMNFLEPSQSLTATISTNSPFVSVLDSVFFIGQLGTLDSISNISNPLRFYVDPSVPPDTEVDIRIDFRDGFYQDFQEISIIVAPSYLDVSNEQLRLTVASNGNLAFVDDQLIEGSGLQYKDDYSLRSLGLMVGSGGQVSDNAIHNVRDQNRWMDFSTEIPIKFLSHPTTDHYARSIFTEPNIGLKMDQRILAWDSPDNEFLIAEYRIINNTASALDSVHVGLIADWDLGDYFANKGDWDPSDSTGYIASDANNLYASVHLITGQPKAYQALDFDTLNSNPMDVSDIFNKTEKYSTIANGIGNTTAGDLGLGNNVAQYTGSSSLSLAPYETITVAFALTVSDSLAGIKNAIAKSKIKYSEYLDESLIGTPVFTCNNTPAIVNPSSGDQFEFYAEKEKTTLLFTGSSYVTDPITAPVSFYIVNIDSLYPGVTERIDVKIKSVATAFIASPDTLFLDETGKQSVHFQDASVEAVSWEWSFSNGFAASVPDPIITFAQNGIFDIDLKSTNSIGCSDSVSAQFVVVERGIKPIVPDSVICKLQSIDLFASNASNLRVYTDAGLSNKIFEGTSFPTGAVEFDTTFFVTSIDSLYESNATEVSITLDPVSAAFTYNLDTTNLMSNYVLNLTNSSLSANGYEWLIDNVSYSSSQDTAYAYDLITPFEIDLVATSSAGCQDTSTSIVAPKISEAIVSDIIELCVGDAVVIKPGSEGIFNFYSDANLTEILGKGTQLALSNLQDSTTIYVSAVDSLFAGPTGSIVLDVSRLAADIASNPDTLNLADQATVLYSNNNVDAIEWTWTFDDDSQQLTQEATYSYNQDGNYDVQLDVSDAHGCLATNRINYIVINVVGISNGFDDDIVLYPNPTHASARIILGSKGLKTVTITDELGRQIEAKKVWDSETNIEFPGPGTYIVLVEIGPKIIQRRVIVLK